MKGFGCFIVSLLNCLIPMLLLISKGYSSQVRGRGTRAPGLLGGGRRRPPKLGRPCQSTAISPPEAPGNTVSSRDEPSCAWLPLPVKVFNCNFPGDKKGPARLSSGHIAPPLMKAMAQVP